MHHDFIKSLRNIVEESAVPRASIVEEAKGLRPRDVTRQGNIVVLDFTEGGRYLIINGVFTTVYRNTIISKAATVLGFAAKKVEDKKFKANADSPKPASTSNGGRHMLVPFAMEDGGRIGAHEQVALRKFAEYAVAKDRLPHRLAHAPPRYP
jgi:hypothetical protein